MRQLKIAGLTLSLATACGCMASNHVDDDSSVDITATSEYELRIVAPDFPDGSQVTLSRMELVDTPKGIEKLVVSELHGGNFNHKGIVTDVHSVGVDVSLPAERKLFGRVYFVLEPGVTEIHFDAEGDFVLKGGQYNDLLVNSWHEDWLYRAGFRSRKRTILEKVVLQHPDPLARALAFGNGGYFAKDTETQISILEGLAQELGDHREVLVNLKNARKNLANEKKRETVTVGKVIKDFQAKNLAGQEFHLADVLKQNKYVLVEFWASWCGPCRGEIPHMKTAYKRFKSKGFEIVSFTLDADIEDWQEASKEEQIPWIDTGDLLARTSPVVKLYGVAGVPANYLVDAQTGTIIAQHLRQEALDNKLAELLGD